MEEAPSPHEHDSNIPSEYHSEEMDKLDNVEHEHHTTLKTLTTEFDNLCHRVETAEGQPTEPINNLEHELHRLSLAFHSSAPPKPLDEVLQQYTETSCTAQKQTTFTNTLIQDIPTFSGSDSTQLEDWLIDIETASNLTE